MIRRSTSGFHCCIASMNQHSSESLRSSGTDRVAGLLHIVAGRSGSVMFAARRGERGVPSRSISATRIVALGALCR
jgi:hypothetical protein